jgi:uncharacterized membrane protein
MTANASLTRLPTGGKRGSSRLETGRAETSVDGGRLMDASLAGERTKPSRHHFRFHTRHAHLSSVFGDDWFAIRAEGFARFFGTPMFLVAQTIVVGFWIAFNVTGLTTFDIYPFILLNLAFSLQAAYAAPLILLAQTRQADRDKVHGDMVEKKHTRLEEATDKAATEIVGLLNSNTSLTQQDKDLTEEVAKLTREIHTLLTQRKGAP